VAKPTKTRGMIVRKYKRGTSRCVENKRVTGVVFTTG
jgi:hypothetical protein